MSAERLPHHRVPVPGGGRVYGPNCVGTDVCLDSLGGAKVTLEARCAYTEGECRTSLFCVIPTQSTDPYVEGVPTLMWRAFPSLWGGRSQRAEQPAFEARMAVSGGIRARVRCDGLAEGTPSHCLGEAPPCQLTSRRRPSASLRPAAARQGRASPARQRLRPTGRRLDPPTADPLGPRHARGLRRGSVRPAGEDVHQHPPIGCRARTAPRDAALGGR